MMKLFVVFCMSVIFIVQDSFGYRIIPYPVDPLSPDEPKPIINAGVIRPDNPNKKHESHDFVELNNGFLPGNRCHWDPQEHRIVCMPDFGEPSANVGNHIPPPIPPYDGGNGNRNGGQNSGGFGDNHNNENEDKRIKREWEWDPNRGGLILPFP